MIKDASDFERVRFGEMSVPTAMKRRKLISELDRTEVIHYNCNVCGRKLYYEDEEKMGMCENCSKE